MEYQVNQCARRALVRVVVALGLTLSSTAARAQTSTAENAARDSRAWIVFGGGSTTVLGECSGCENGTYSPTGSALVGGGVSLSPQADLGAELLWIPLTLRTGGFVRSTLLMASVQVRPWRTHGFFLKGASGMAFLRNWLDVVEDPSASSSSKAFCLGLGAGWEWATRTRVGFQVAGTQHVVALGDLAGRERRLENVIGNFWSLSGSVIIR